METEDLLKEQLKKCKCTRLFCNDCLHNSPIYETLAEILGSVCIYSCKKCRGMFIGENVIIQGLCKNCVPIERSLVMMNIFLCNKFSPKQLPKCLWKMIIDKFL